jgi:hypothetical protein
MPPRMRAGSRRRARISRGVGSLRQPVAARAGRALAELCRGRVRGRVRAGAGSAVSAAFARVFPACVLLCGRDDQGDAALDAMLAESSAELSNAEERPTGIVSIRRTCPSCAGWTSSRPGLDDPTRERWARPSSSIPETRATAPSLRPGPELTPLRPRVKGPAPTQASMSAKAAPRVGDGRPGPGAIHSASAATTAEHRAGTARSSSHWARALHARRLAPGTGWPRRPGRPPSPAARRARPRAGPYSQRRMRNASMASTFFHHGSLDHRSAGTGSVMATSRRNCWIMTWPTSGSTISTAISRL